MIKHLSTNGCEVTVASLARSNSEAEEGQGLRDHCARVIMEQVNTPGATIRMLSRLLTPVPSSMGYFFSPRLKRRIHAALEDTRFDLIFVHCSSVAQYVEDVKTTPKMLDFGDMDSQKWLIYSKVRSLPLSLGYLLEGVKLQRAEAALARKFDYCTCTTKAELETLKSYKTGTRVGWFPNGVDTDYFQPTKEPYDPDTLSFIGRMDYYPNQQAAFDFCEHTLPMIQAERPNVKLLIVGANPSRAVQRLGDLPGITVTGSVPDVRPYVHRSAVNVAPLSIARGTQNKILESMAMAVPVVASEQATAGVDAQPGEHLLSATSAEGYKNAILELLDNPQRRNQLARKGRECVIHRHNWRHSMEKLDELIAECIGEKRLYEGMPRREARPSITKRGV